jgi:GNAT superfamily N-acetyltransferase
LQTHFKAFEGEDIDIDKLIAFLNEHYNYSTSIQILYSKEYLKWFFSNAGILGVIENDKEWLSLFGLGDFTLRYHDKQGAIFYGGSICVHKRYTFTGLGQKIVKETAEYAQSQYKIPVLGAGVQGVKKDRMFQNFGMFLSKKLNPPKNKCFSSNNLYLCDDSDFLKKFKTEQGFAYYYFQDVIYEKNKERWLVIPSYFTHGCWKTLIYECSQFLKGRFDKILIFENLERKKTDLYEIGFEYFTPYHLYLESPINLPRYFLYYNLFLY